MTEEQKRVPRSVRAALNKLDILGVVGGYMTQIGSLLDAPADAYTCWDREGTPVCVLYRRIGQKEWSTTHPVTTVGRMIQKAQHDTANARGAV